MKKYAYWSILVIVLFFVHDDGNWKVKGSGPFYSCKPGLIYGSNCYHYTTKYELETKVRPWLRGE